MPLVLWGALWYTEAGCQTGSGSIGYSERRSLHVCASERRGLGRLKATMSKNALLSRALRKVQSRFLLVNLLTKRIRELKDGTLALIPRGNTLSVEEVALREIAEGKITPQSTLPLLTE